jgi:hypothetical protein
MTKIVFQNYSLIFYYAHKPTLKHTQKKEVVITIFCFNFPMNSMEIKWNTILEFDFFLFLCI